MRIRTIKTGSGKRALQVVSKRLGHLTIHKHIGTYSNPDEKAKLLKKAEDFIGKATGQGNLLDLLSPLRPSEIVISESRPLFVYQLLCGIYEKLGFGKYPDLLIRDLVVARIYAPVSKRETKEILSEMFNRRWALVTIYRHLKKGIEHGLKDTFQNSLIEFARNDLGDDLRLVFYDVTTLYFDSAVKSGIRDFGFSKDHRPLDTQIVIGLVVNRDGFPLYFDVFAGNTFEGHTFLPVIQKVKQLLGNTDLVVIADAAMISKDNIDKLIAGKIGFVVGARVANLPSGLIDEISKRLNAEDGKTTTVIYHNQRLICQYSAKRATKDKSDRLKQIAKATNAITNPSKITNRFRFLKTDGQKASLNQDLVAKATKLEGVKGYLTNTKLPAHTVIDRYHDLWRIENSFRITKSDLEARPIFHRLDETIKAHLVIVFAGLAISKYLEMKTGMSIHKILKLSEKVLTHKVTNPKTGEEAYIETTIEDPALKEKINLLKSLGH